MWKQLGLAFRVMLLLTLATGIAYPLLVTGLSQLFFPAQANGSLVYLHGKIAGSRFIGQEFEGSGYFHSRPSAAGYNPMASGGTNLGPTSQALLDRMRKAVAEFHANNPQFHGPIPADLLTASGSGLDPDISPASAAAQAARVAAARDAEPAQVEALVHLLTQPPQLGFLGEARVNVLELNLALDQRFPVPHRP
ncbi:MAG TPA: potassium-transporting ATPase subunit KdpC [Terriglobales bacterium]|nr:potassium-transporting ATPase subunit KdpC [Terriglobales bacterium]